MKLKFHQMKITDIARTTAFEIAEIESEIAEIEFAEIAEIERFVNAVFSFVVVVASFAVLINFRFDALIVSIVVSIAVTKSFAFDAVKMNLMMIKSWFVDRFFDQMFSFAYNAFYFLLTFSRIQTIDLTWIVFFRNMRSFFRSFSELTLLFWMYSLKSSLSKCFDAKIFKRLACEKINEKQSTKFWKRVWKRFRCKFQIHFKKLFIERRFWNYIFFILSSFVLNRWWFDLLYNLRVQIRSNRFSMF